MDKHTALAYLKDVPEGKEFFVVNGFLLRNLRDLREALAGISPEVFAHHVTAQRNDFANWIEDIIGDKELAAALRKTKDQKKMQVLVKNRIDTLKTIISAAYYAEMKAAEKRMPQPTTTKPLTTTEEKIPSPASLETAKLHKEKIEQEKKHNEQHHSDAYYRKHEEQLKEHYRALLVKDFFYGMAVGILLALVLLRLYQLLW
ncbi:MAG: hypothetical protein QW594_02065 [Candidatus Woesearchaeota archaeon]